MGVMPIGAERWRMIKDNRVGKFRGAYRKLIDAVLSVDFKGHDAGEGDSCLCVRRDAGG